MKNSFLFLAVLAISAFGLRCGEGGSSGGFTVGGTLRNAGNMQVYLDQVGISPNSANLVKGKADADGTGKFTLSLPENLREGIYRIRVGEQKIGLVLDGSERKVEVNGDLANLNLFEYEVNGSQSSLVYRNVMQQLVARKMSADDVKNFVDTTANPFTAILVSVQAIGGNPSLLSVHEKAAKRLTETYPGSSYIADYQGFIASVQQAAVNPGGSGYQFIEADNRQPAPDIKLPNPAGKEYALSDLKGKVVLLDFWASWCGPCRRENPNVVRIYNKYKDQGFTVFSVSLDGIDSRQMAMIENDAKKVKEALEDQKKRWKDAISQDGLMWDYHVSDLKKWECAPARLYGVNSIPRTFMIDKDGKVAAVNLRGAEQIEEALQKLL